MSSSLQPHGIVHGILQVRILEWVAVPFSRGSSQPGDRTQVSRIAGRCFTLWATREARNAKVGNKEIPGVTGKFGLRVQNKAGQRLTEFCQENALVVANTVFQQHKRRLDTWISPDGQNGNQSDYILCSQRWRSSIWLAKTRLELTVAQIMNSLLPNSDLNWRKWGKTTRLFKYDLNQIP